MTPDPMHQATTAEAIVIFAPIAPVLVGFALVIIVGVWEEILLPLARVLRGRKG